MSQYVKTMMEEEPLSATAVVELLNEMDEGLAEIEESEAIDLLRSGLDDSRWDRGAIERKESPKLTQTEPYAGHPAMHEAYTSGWTMRVLADRPDPKVVVSEACLWMLAHGQKPRADESLDLGELKSVLAHDGIEPYRADLYGFRHRLERLREVTLTRVFARRYDRLPEPV